MGPTASGKTELAMAISDILPCEIISVDSTQVYKGMDIGSAKPSQEELEKYPHHLIDIRDPSDAYSVASFRTDVLRLIEEILLRGHIPLLVGGTMLYFKALMTGLSDLPKANQDVRRTITMLAKSKGWGAVHDCLAAVDPQAAMRIHENDSQRLQRALEIYMVSGKTMTELQLTQRARHYLPYTFLNLAITPDNRSILHERIALRCKKMFDHGFIDEVKGLYAREDLNLNLPAIRSVGYRQVWNFLEAGGDLETTMYKCIIATRQLAKRQLTWLRSWLHVNWFNSLSSSLLSEVLASINDARKSIDSFH